MCDGDVNVCGDGGMVVCLTKIRKENKLMMIMMIGRPILFFLFTRTDRVVMQENKH